MPLLLTRDFSLRKRSLSCANWSLKMHKAAFSILADTVFEMNLENTTLQEIGLAVGEANSSA